MRTIELKLGIMTNTELAEWFGMKNEKSFRSNRKKKIEELKKFAKFEDLKGKGKVEIIEIIDPVYNKKRSEDLKMIKDKVYEEWSNTGLDTCKFVSNKIKNKYSNKLTVADSTLYNYTCKSKRELWGIPYKTEGEIGYCICELCKIINNECVPFTDEENEIKKQLLKLYFDDVEDNEKAIYIQDMIDNGEITKDEAWEIYQNITNFKNRYRLFKADLEKRIKYKITRATRVQDNAFYIRNGKFNH